VTDERREQVLRSVRRLMADASSSDVDEVAAAHAAALAHALCAKYHIEQDELLGEQPPHMVKETMLENYDEHWRRILGEAVSELFFCRYLWRSTERIGSRSGKPQKALEHQFYGRAHNVVVAKEMTRYLIDRVNYIGRQASRGQAENKVRYMLSFFAGCAQRICERLRERRSQTARGETPALADGREGITNLPALLPAYEREERLNDEFIASLGIKPRLVRIKLNRRSADGFQAGRRAGNDVGLDTQLGAASRPKLPPAPSGGKVASAAAALLGRRR
jgi:hypothetical protein